MAQNAKEVRETSFQKRGDYCHIETKGCIVNIYPCLIKEDGRPTTAIEVLPNTCLGDEYVFDLGHSMTRVVRNEE